MRRDMGDTIVDGRALLKIMGNFGGIPGQVLRAEVELLVNTLSANRGLYDPHIFANVIHALRMSVQRTAQLELRSRD